MNALRADIMDWLADSENAWSIGALGAIAEFSRDSGEAAVVDIGDDAAQIETAKGVLALDLSLKGLRAVAYEGLSAHKDRWTQTVDICLPEASAAMNRRSVLTEVEDRDGTRLFDLGLGVANLDACVRAEDDALADLLRAHAGKPVLDPGNPVMPAVKEASPPRVFVSRLARIEVRQPIGSTAKGIPTPDGPHTHVLPDLLRTGRVFAATAPVPEGLLPVLTLHPAGLFAGHDGAPRDFSATRFARFQDLLDRYAPDGYVAEKRRIAAAVATGVDPADYEPGPTRAARLAARVGLRQIPYFQPGPDLDAWRARFDRGGGAPDGHAD